MCYTYDELSRVTKRTIVNLSDNSETVEEFEYDAAGNVVGDTAENAYVYDENNRLISYNGEEVTYDADGNMTIGGDLICTFDSYNRLVKCKTANFGGQFFVCGLPLRQLNKPTSLTD